jgi:hypothetical protein
VPEPVDWGRVAARGGEWPPKQALVQFGGAAVRIAVNGVGITGLQVARRKHVDHADLAAEIGDVCRDPIQHTIGISFGQRLRPTVRRVEFAGCIATGRVRHLL